MSDMTNKTDNKLEKVEQLSGIEKLLAVVAELRNPEGGCPWDLKQTHQTLRPYLLEESYEAVEALTSGVNADICEELGDVLLQVVLHAQIAKDNQTFNFTEVADGIADKLIRRHPHVFADTTVDSAEQVTQNWEAIKQQEKAQNVQSGKILSESVLKGVKANQPALLRAYETSKKAVKVGFEWPDFESLWACVMSEYDELREELVGVDPEGEIPEEKRLKLEDELGDIFFASVNLARYLGTNPEVAMTRATDKFTRRFKAMEGLIAEKYSAKPIAELQDELDFETWDALWNEAKKVTNPK